MVPKFIVFALFVLSAHPLLARDLVVVSDLDETLRMANVEDHLRAGAKLVTGVKPYVGLTKIFQELQQKNPTAKFYYLSNSYTFLYKGKQWSLDHGLPKGVVYQRALSDKSDDFKSVKLNQIAKANPDASFLLFGDNVERDPMFYRKFRAENQLAESKVFIRDARLIFPATEADFVYFQSETQITEELNVSPQTTAAIRALPRPMLIPNFLLKNLKDRLIKDCTASEANCVEQARARVQEVLDLVSPR